MQLQCIIYLTRCVGYKSIHKQIKTKQRQEFRKVDVARETWRELERENRWWVLIISDMIDFICKLGFTLFPAAPGCAFPPKGRWEVRRTSQRDSERSSWSLIQPGAGGAKPGVSSAELLISSIRV